MDERGVGRHRDITGLHELHNLVLLAVVFQLHLLGIDFHCGLRVVVDVHVDLISYFSSHGEVDFLIEVEPEGLAAVSSE